MIVLAWVANKFEQRAEEALVIYTNVKNKEDKPLRVDIGWWCLGSLWLIEEMLLTSLDVCSLDGFFLLELVRGESYHKPLEIPSSPLKRAKTKDPKFVKGTSNQMSSDPRQQTPHNHLHLISFYRQVYNLNNISPPMGNDP